MGADLVDVKEIGVGGQPTGDLLEEIRGEGGPAGGGHKDEEHEEDKG